MNSGKLPVIISVPHGGTTIPGEVKSLCRADLPAILRDGDTWSRELYALKDQVLFYNDTHIARAAVDLNREPGDRPPVNPDGVVKTFTINGEQVWHDPAGLPGDKADLLIQRYHMPYHRTIQEACGNPEAVLGLDCHTMLGLAPAGNSDPFQPRPLLCLSNRGDIKGLPTGEEPTTAPEGLLRALQSSLAEQFQHEDVQVKADGPPVTLNHPFRGGFITRYHGTTTPIPWIQVEISRALYMPENPCWTVKPPLEVMRRLKDIRTKFLKGLKKIL